jgi:hypothetical protein
VKNSPQATLYIFRRNGKAVAIAVGQYPPDPGLTYDSLLRIPIVANGDRPSWRAFTWHLREPLSKALARSQWPDVIAPAGNGDKPRHRRKKLIQQEK